MYMSDIVVRSMALCQCIFLCIHPGRLRGVGVKFRAVYPGTNDSGLLKWSKGEHATEWLA
jgi:hypothetical protein